MRKTAFVHLAFLVSLIMSWNAVGAYAEQSLDRRAKAGIKLFRTMLAADLDIAGKKDADGFLRLLLVYRQGEENAEKLSESLKKSGRSGSSPSIRNLPIRVETTSAQSLDRYTSSGIAGIFITDQIGADDLEKIIRYGIERHVIVYSPFEGHVEKGALGGLAVEARVRPYINIKTLKASKIRLKPFFMKVAKRYE